MCACHTLTIHNKLVHPTGTKGRAYSSNNHLAGIDVADDLGSSLGAVSALLQEDYRGALCGTGTAEAVQ